ncbi:MAG: uracil-DNA glycosylase [Chloroflexi bacterium]|nr:uracil-DNA glycosylase [Chloroflexota bacterium]
MPDSLDLIAQEIASCTKCPLHQGRTNTVPGEGPATSDIMLIGEGPGFYEDQSGRPFVGASGRFLEELLQGIGLSREMVFIGNVVKCRPPENRDPAADEIAACKAYLDRQIETIDPKVIVTLGRFSMARWFPKARISKIHGQPRRFGSRLVVPMYHPAAGLRSPKVKEEIVLDFNQLPALIDQVKSWGEPPQDDAEDPDSDDPVQLSLF